MKKNLLNLLMVFLLSTCGIEAYGQFLSKNLFFTSTLSGSNSIPSNSTKAVGTVSLTLSSDFKSAYVLGHLTGFTEKVTAAHIHKGKAGISGPVLKELEVLEDSLRLSAFFSITPSDLKDLIEGNFYINVHTASSPNGEIRGQLKLESEISYTVRLDGGQQIPSNSSKGFGLGTLKIDNTKKLAQFIMVYSGIDTIKSSHFHSGASGTNGSVVLDLGSFTFLSTNYVQTTINLDDTTKIKDYAQFILDLEAGNIYTNIHTSSYPNGEIRGQFIKNNGVVFDAFLEGSNQTPKKIFTDAKGVGFFQLNTTMDSISVDIVYDTVEDFQAAHFHFGKANRNGSVAVDLLPLVSKNRIKGMIKINQTFLDSLFEENIYINIHNKKYPNGVIRSQVNRYNREGFLLSVIPDFVNINSTAKSSGGGWVSVAADKSDAITKIALNNLSSVVKKASFYKGNFRQNAFSEIVDFSGSIKNSFLDVIWNNGWSPKYANMLENDSIFFMVNTDNFTNGEIKGYPTKASRVLRNIKDVELNADFTPGYTIKTILEGKNEVPATSSSAKGIAYVTYNDSFNSAKLSLYLDGLGSDTMTSAHIHFGKKGANGGVIFDLKKYINKNKISCFLPSRFVTKDSLGKFLRGDYYINIHTKNFPNGVIRGQFGIEKQLILATHLTGTSIVPTPKGYNIVGFSQMEFNKKRKTARLSIYQPGLKSRVRSVEFRSGTGVKDKDTGTFMKLISNRLMIKTENIFDFDLMNWTNTFYDSLVNEKIQLVIKTDDNPNGEIKGTLFGSRLINYKCTPLNIGITNGIVTPSSSKALIRFNSTFDTLFHYVYSSSNFDTIKTVSLMNENGKTILIPDPNLTGRSNETNMGFNVYRAFNDTLLRNKLLGGKILLTTKNKFFPKGEVIGYLTPTYDQTFGFDLCGNQEVPGITSNGGGMAAVTIGPDREKISYDVVVSDLSSAITSSHFHVGNKGSNGPVIRDITSDYTGNYGSGVWYSKDSSMAHDTILLNGLTEGRVYLNVHTSNNTGGEIRGQVIKGSECFIAVGIENQSKSVSAVQAYPVPVNEELNIRFTSNEFFNASFQMMDIQGRLISNTNSKITNGQNQIVLNTSSLVPGVYLVNIQSNGIRLHTIKFFKK